MVYTGRFLHFLFEGLVLYLFFMPFYTQDNLPLAMVPFFTVYILAGIAVYLLFRNKKELSTASPMLLMPFAVALSWVLGFPIILAVTLGVIACWRSFLYLIRFEDVSDGVNPFGLFFFSLASALYLYILHINEAAGFKFLAMAAIQFVFLLIMTGWDRLASLPVQQQNRKGSFLRWGGGLLACLAGASAVLVLAYQGVKWLFFSGIGLIARIAGYVVAYPASWLVSALSNQESAKNVKNMLQNSNSQQSHEPQHPLPHDSDTLPFGLIFLVMAGIVFIIIFVIVYRRNYKGMNQARLQEAYQGSAAVSLSMPVAAGKQRKRVAAPKNEVRRRFYKLQKGLAAVGLGRHANEPVEEWFDRLTLSTDHKNIVAHAYRKVRYGGETLSGEEMLQYRDAVNELIREAKKNQKGNA